MKDVIVILVVLGFFALCAAYVTWCERVLAADSPDRVARNTNDACPPPWAWPFGMAELLARLRATLRRSPTADQDVPEVRNANFRLDVTAHRAFVGAGGTEVRLTPTEWSIVIYLVRNPERLVTYRQLVTAVWGPTYDPDQNLLRVHMTHIRHKLEPDPARPRYFITDSGMGYRYQA